MALLDPLHRSRSIRAASLREFACSEVVEVVVLRLVTLGTQTGDVEGLDVRLDAGRRTNGVELVSILDRSAHFRDGPVFIGLGRGASSHPSDVAHATCRSLDTNHAVVRHDGLLSWFRAPHPRGDATSLGEHLSHLNLKCQDARIRESTPQDATCRDPELE
jgi:hypothetical protein